MSNNMADKLKRKLSAKNATAMILFGAIIMVFVFFGLPSRLRGGLGAAARVNETFISFGEFQTAAEQLENMYAQYMGGRIFDPEQRKGLKMQALQRLIDEELAAQAARHSGILATDTEIRDLITKEIPAFQKDGQFQRENYMGYLQSQGLNPGEFETRIRKQVEAMRLRRLFEASSRTLSLEADKQKTLQNYKINLTFAKFDDDNPSVGMISQQDAEKALSNEEFKKKVENEFTLKKTQLSQPEQVHAQHILVSFKQGDAASEKAALAKIQDLKKKATGEDFGALAAKNSDDPGSKAKNGDLGFFGHGAMVKEFDEVAFKLPPGQISDPVKSPYGYHLIKVLEKKTAKEAKLEDHQLSLAKELLAKEKWQKKSQEIEGLLSTNPAQAEAEVKNMGAKWEDTGLFTLDAASIPKIQGLEIEKIAGLNAKEPFLKNFVRAGNARYIVKLKEIKQEAPISPINDEMVQRRRADGMFTAWIQNFKKNSDIETNDLIFQ
jgi:parvulin-like peptidyl-prolyl isomerase